MTVSTSREPSRIAELATIVAVNRGDDAPIQGDRLIAALGSETAARVRFASMPGIHLSATDIRRRVREGKSIRYMTPRAVEQYILEHRLYLE